MLHPMPNYNSLWQQWSWKCVWSRGQTTVTAKCQNQSM